MVNDVLSKALIDASCRDIFQGVYTYWVTQAAAGMLLLFTLAYAHYVQVAWNDGLSHQYKELADEEEDVLAEPQALESVTDSAYESVVKPEVGDDAHPVALPQDPHALTNAPLTSNLPHTLPSPAQQDALDPEDGWVVPAARAPFTAHIISVQYASADSPSTHFIIEVCTTSRPHTQWQISKRYSDFDGLRRALQADSVHVPRFPRKHMLRSNTTTVANQRKEALGNFLDEVVLQHWEHSAVVAFLELEKRRSPTGQTRGSEWIDIAHPFNPFEPFARADTRPTPLPAASTSPAGASTDQRYSEEERSRMLAMAHEALRRAEEEQASD